MNDAIVGMRRYIDRGNERGNWYFLRGICRSWMDKRIVVNVLGELTLSHDGRGINLPASRKTRALLAFLCLTARPHRRERLCDCLLYTSDAADDW